MALEKSAECPCLLGNKNTWILPYTEAQEGSIQSKPHMKNPRLTSQSLVAYSRPTWKQKHKMNMMFPNGNTKSG